MDGSRFDDLARRLAGDRSRRSLLKTSVAAVVALAGLGSRSEAEAARRPRPTPARPSCPGLQTPCDGGCCCPEGTARCGSDCCPPEAQCCDGACCYGTCYGDERCCPAGQLVCDGQCVGAGDCCSSDDCAAGWACGAETSYVCGCVPAVTCAAKGWNCGALIDDCGHVLDCGSCQAPESCGGGGTAGVCGCTVSTTCDGRCGEIETNCGTTLQCGDCAEPDTCGGGGTVGVCGCTVTTTCGVQCGEITTNCGTTLDCGACADACGDGCGICQVCSGGTCVDAENDVPCGEGCRSGRCASGDCDFFYTIQCPGGDGSRTPDDACNSYQCVQTPEGVSCVGSIANEGGSCDPTDPCETGLCHQGTCVGTPIECPACQECRTGACEPNTGNSCGPEHRCVAGTCSHFPTGTPPANTNVEGICSSLKCADACCPGPASSDCCDSMDDCFLSDNGGFFGAYCCDSADKCGNDCCWSGKSCAGGTVCRPDDKICANDPYCAEACCGGNGNAGSGTCCPSGQRCVGDICTPVPTGSCGSHADCGSNAVCAGLEFNQQTGVVLVAGTCCLTPYSAINTTVSGNLGYVYYECCAAPNYVNVTDGNVLCCSYENAACGNCSCSRTSVRRWGN